MKKRLIMITVLITMVISMIAGCASKENDAVINNNVSAEDDISEDDIQESESSKAEEVNSENEETGDVAEEVVEEVVEEEVFEFTEEYALEKITRAISAYEDILKSHDDFSINMCNYIDVEIGLDAFEDLTTSDGFLICDATDWENLGQERVDVAQSSVYGYLDNYINNNGEYYSIAEYISSNTKDDILKNDVATVPASENRNTNLTYLRGLTWLASILTLNPEKISTNKIIGRDEIEASDFTKEIIRYRNDDVINIEYLVSIIVNDTDTGLDAAFDSDGNLLNILDDSRYNGQIPHKSVYDLVDIQQ